MTLIFETKKFRVQITGKCAWVEVSEGGRWVFRNQHNLPLSLSIARGRNSISVLRAAVEHYERVHDGDPALRAAITGSVVPPKPATSVVVAEKPKPPVQDADASQPTLQRSRGPLRPPLARLEIGLPQRV
jgi:hypothetical protein